jgi:hypothetical protein
MSDVESELKALYRQATPDHKLAIMLALWDITDDEDGFASLLRATPEGRKEAVLEVARALVAGRRASSSERPIDERAGCNRSATRSERV